MGYRNEPFIHGKQLRVAERIIGILNNKVAISAFHAYMDEKYDEYGELIDILEDKYAYNCVIHGIPPKYAEYLKKTR